MTEFTGAKLRALTVRQQFLWEIYRLLVSAPFIGEIYDSMVKIRLAIIVHTYAHTHSHFIYSSDY